MNTPIPPIPIMTPAKPENEARGSKAVQPVEESIAASGPPIEGPNPLLHALSGLFGGRTLPARQSIDLAAVGSTGWVVQVGGPSSEAEAKRDLKRLNARYGSALKGPTVGLRKVLVKGETVYVVGLSRDEAAVLCSRVKGDGGSCSIVR
jgi:hypothetical protein